MFELKVCQMSHRWCMQALGLSKWIDEFPGDFTFASDCRWPANRHIPFRIYLNRFWFGIQGSGADTPWQALEMLFEAAQKKNHLRYLLGS